MSSIQDINENSRADSNVFSNSKNDIEGSFNEEYQEASTADPKANGTGL